MDPTNATTDTPTPRDKPGGVGIRLSGGRWLCFCPVFRWGQPNRYKANPETRACCAACGATRPAFTPPTEAKS